MPLLGSHQVLGTFHFSVSSVPIPLLFLLLLLSYLDLECHLLSPFLGSPHSAMSQIHLPTLSNLVLISQYWPLLVFHLFDWGQVFCCFIMSLSNSEYLLFSFLCPQFCIHIIPGSCFCDSHGLPDFLLCFFVFFPVVLTTRSVPFLFQGLFLFHYLLDLLIPPPCFFICWSFLSWCLP